MLRFILFSAFTAFFSFSSLFAQERSSEFYFNLPASNLSTVTSDQQLFKLQSVVSGLSSPWAVAFLPDGDVLITEKTGQLRIVRNGQLLNDPVANLPEVWVNGQGGLLDVVLHPDYESNGWIYFSYSTPNNGTGNTGIFRAQLSNDALSNIEFLYSGSPNTSSGQHFAGRMAFDNDTLLYFSIGDRGVMDNAQDVTISSGKVHRIHADGSIPESNPFWGDETKEQSIFSYGHRNPQGMMMHPETGEIWTHEHGPKGGDEVNIHQNGANYGWPEVTFGEDYDGSVISPDTAGPGFTQPIYYWDPSIAPSGMTFITSSRYPDWQGDILLGSLKFQRLHRLEIEDKEVTQDEIIASSLGRVRDVYQAPDGYLYYLEESNGSLVRILPEISASLAFKLQNESYGGTVFISLLPRKFLSNSGQARTISFGLDPYDAYELAPLSSNYVQIYTKAEEQDLTVSAIPYDSNHFLRIPLFFNSTSSSDHTLTIERWSDGLPESWSFYLYDHEADSIGRIDTSLSTTVSFPANEETRRFSLFIDPNLKKDSLALSGSSGWRLLSVPFNQTSLWPLYIHGQLQGINDDFELNLYTHYNGSAWETTGTLDTLLQRGSGFLYHAYSEPTSSRPGLPISIPFSGTQTTSNVTVPLHQDGDGWNLLGNPFLLPFHMSELQVHGGSLQSTVGQLWDAQKQIYTTTTAQEGLIQPWNGVFIHNSDADSVTFRNAGTVNQKSTPVKLLTTGLVHSKSGQLQSETYLLFDEPSSDTTELLDLRVFNSFLHSRSRIAWELSDTLYIQQSLPAVFETEKERTLSLTDLTPHEEYSLKFTFTDAVSEDYTFEIHDLNSDQRYPLDPQNPDITFTPSTDQVMFTLRITPDEPTSITTPSDDQPYSFSLGSNYPNPFNPATTIPYSIGEAGQVSLVVYNLVGQRIATLAHGNHAPGTYNATFQANHLTSGFYVYRLIWNGNVIGQKSMMMIK